MILGIETSGLLCSAAFVKDNQILGEYNHEIPRQHASILGNVIETGGRFLASHNMASDNFMDDIELVAIAIGPGSFTGLRIGLSYAQGICLGEKIPVVGISNHQILAVYGAYKFENVYTTIDAHRDEVYLAEMALKDENYFEILTHEIINKQDGIVKRMPVNSCLITANKEILDQPVCEELRGKQIDIINGRYSAAMVAKIGAYKYREYGGDKLSELEPLYIRPFAGVK